jgi:hypothetical protein
MAGSIDCCPPILFIFAQGVELFVDVFEAFVGYVSVDLRSHNAFVAKEFLYGA